MFNLVPHDLVDLLQLVNFSHQLVDMALVHGRGNGNVIKCGGYIPSRYYIVYTVISCLSCTQIMGELEVVISVCKKY